MATAVHSVTVGHGCSWTLYQGVIKTLRFGPKWFEREKQVRVDVDRPAIGVSKGDVARISHIMVPDRKSSPYSAHVLMLSFGDRFRDGHFFAPSEVTPLSE
ncbi:MAG: hypothetical protein KW802_04095 [Candidatus Doudnabacteria bacterium]|nr:hypothetical protein [Candidatus Doudnabacteria bacterium]